MKVGTAVLAVVVFAVGVGPLGARASGDAGQAVAITRCDNKNINDYETQLRDWEAHPARGSDDQVKRIGDIQDVIAGLGQERGVLDAVCPDNMARGPFYTQIAADEAWGYLLQAETAQQIGPPCPAAGVAIPNQLTASAWFTLSGNVKEMGATAPSIAKMVTKVQAEAAKIALTLPTLDDASAYWVSTVTEATKAAIEACHLPPPTPSPTPSPVQSPYNPRGANV